MFRCQFSGEVSSPAIWKTEKVNERRDDGTWIEKVVKSFISGPEKPMKVVIESRRRDYDNTIRTEEDGRIDWKTSGTEIVKELTIRVKHLAAVKEKYGLT